MITHLFSQLISELTGDLSPSGIQKEILAKPIETLTPVQNVGLFLFWNHLAGASTSGAARLDPSVVMAVMTGLPEVQDATDDFYFI
jgi:hypothetical protein